MSHLTCIPGQWTCRGHSCFSKNCIFWSAGTYIHYTACSTQSDSKWFLVDRAGNYSLLDQDSNWVGN